MNDLTQQQTNWNRIDGVLRTWDNIREHSDLCGVANWDLPTFASEVFTGWDIVVILRHENAVAITLRLDDLLFALPVYWPEGAGAQPTSETDDNPTDDEDDWDDDVHADGAWREASFDAALSDSISGTQPMSLLDGLYEDDNLVAGSDKRRLALALTGEAVILSAPPDEQDGMRVLLGLRGINQFSGYQRIA